MSHSAVPGMGTGREASGALDELLQAEREIAGELAGADARGARIVEEARAERARRREAAHLEKVRALADLEARLRASASAEESDARARALATCRLFDEATPERVDQLADDMLAHLYGLATERAP